MKRENILGPHSKSQGKPGIVREFRIIFIQIREKSGKTDYLVLILFSLSLSCLFGKWLFNLLSVNVNFITLHSAIANICTLRCQINAPPYMNFKEIDFFCKPLISFPSFVGTIYAQFSWQNSALLYMV